MYFYLSEKTEKQHNFYGLPFSFAVSKRQKIIMISCSVTRSVISRDTLECIMLLYSKDSTLSMCHFSFAFLHCEFSNVSSNCLHEKMQSHIGCIYLIFLHCAFSNVSSNCLPERRQSHIGCICSTFPHCVFSYDPSKGLHNTKQSYIGCLCLTFLHCAFSNVFSNGLYVKMNSHIGCICLTFLHCTFSNVSSNCLPKKRHSCIDCICFIICVSQGNTNIDHTFSKVIICKILIHHQ